MSQENVEIIRRAYDALERGDLDLLASEFYDPQIEWQTSREDPDAATHRGREAVRRYYDQWLDSFEGLHADVEEYIDAGDSVIVFVLMRTKGRDSGIETARHDAQVHRLHEGLVVETDYYNDRGQALKAVGLE